MQRTALLILPLTLTLAAGCSSSGSSKSTSPGATTPITTPVGTDGGSTDATNPPATGGDVCSLVTEADLAVLFPEATPQPSRGTSEYCAWDVLWAAGGGSGVFNMGQNGLSYDSSLASNQGQYQVSQLDGIGTRAYYFSHYLMFELNGTTYDLSVGNYDQGHQPDPAAEQDTLMRIAAAYAALLGG